MSAKDEGYCKLITVRGFSGLGQMREGEEGCDVVIQKSVTKKNICDPLMALVVTWRSLHLFLYNDNLPVLHLIQLNMR